MWQGMWRESSSIKLQESSKTLLERGIYELHLIFENNLKNNQEVVCLASELMCPWKDMRKELNEHASQCPYLKLKPILSLLMDKIKVLQQKVDAMEILLQNQPQPIHPLSIISNTPAISSHILKTI